MVLSWVVRKYIMINLIKKNQKVHSVKNVSELFSSDKRKLRNELFGSYLSKTFVPETGSFETQVVNGMLELVSMTGSITTDENKECCHHTHAIFSYKKDGKHLFSGGHIKSITVLYTAEIELRPVIGGTIKRKRDEETGTGFWDFSE